MITLTNESIDLINYCLGKANIKNNNIHIKKLYNLFESYYNDNIEYNINKCNNKINISNPFISNNIIKSINKLNNCHSINSKINNNNINIIVYHNEENLDIFINVILKYIKFMYNLSDYNKNIHIIYYLTNNEKQINNNKRNIILKPDNVNTGSSNIDKIEIWRKEELLKTTIHELIHHMNLDYRNDSIDLINNYKNKYNISSDIINSFESYVDFWAILINIYLCTKILNNPYQFFIKIIYLEIYFIKFQAQKVLYISRNNNNNVIDINKYTNILSYYIIKAELFQNINKTLLIMDYNIKIKNLDNYFKYIKNLKKINNNNIFYHINKDNYIYKTMRMSLCDINIFD